MAHTGTYRKYDTCFFERYAALSLQMLLGHKFDGLVNVDRPDLQSEDGKTLGIEVTRAMEGGKAAAQVLLKEMAGISPVTDEELLRTMFDRGYTYGLAGGNVVGSMELGYWRMAKPLKDIIKSKVYKVTGGFYGRFDEFGLYVFSQEVLPEETVFRAMKYTMELQNGADLAYARLFLSDLSSIYACNLEDGISDEYRITAVPIDKDQRKQLYLGALEL